MPDRPHDLFRGIFVVDHRSGRQHSVGVFSVALRLVYLNRLDFLASWASVVLGRLPLESAVVLLLLHPLQERPRRRAAVWHEGDALP
jgi:hypothetical protein